MDLLLQNDDCRVHIRADHGGRIASLEILGEELLVGAQADPLSWGSYPLAPWAGRLRDGRFRFEGHEYCITSGRDRHPLHGTVFTRPWKRVAADALRCDLGQEWPFPGFALQRFRLDSDAFTACLELHACNSAFPASAGFHPWFRRQLSRGGALALDCDAARRLLLDNDGLPAGGFGPGSLRGGDDCLHGLHRDPCLHWPGVLKLHLASSHPWWVVYEQPEHALCVEPWTAPPDALNSRPTIVRPGAPLILEMRMRWESDDGHRGA